MVSFTISDDLIATHWQRIANYLLDLVFQMIFMFCVLTGVIVIALLAKLDGLIYWTLHMGIFHQYLFAIVIAILYYGLSETLLGRSIGKFITGTIIVMEDGSAPDSHVILKRTFCRLIPLEWITFLGMPSRGWHDSIPGVYVVDKKLFDAARQKFKSQTKSSTDITAI